MTAKRLDIAGLPGWPALLSVAQAAAYCGMSRGSFEACVEAGTFPKPVELPIRRKLPEPVDLPMRRKLWHRAALDAAIAKGSPDANDREARRAAWAKRQNRSSQAGQR